MDYWVKKCEKLLRCFNTFSKCVFSLEVAYKKNYWFIGICEHKEDYGSKVKIDTECIAMVIDKLVRTQTLKTFWAHIALGRPVSIMVWLR